MDKETLQQVHAIPPIMVLRESSDSRLLFSFRSLLWGCITAPFAVLLSVLAYHMISRQDVPLLIRIFIVILALAFTYSTVYSFTTRRSLEIDFIRGIAVLRQTTLFGEKQRSEPFDQFKQITVSRYDDETANFGIELEYADGWIEYLGWNEFGALSLARAMELVDKIAPKMGIRIHAPTYFEERPLKGAHG